MSLRVEPHRGAERGRPAAERRDEESTPPPAPPPIRKNTESGEGKPASFLVHSLCGCTSPRPLCGRCTGAAGKTSRPSMNRRVIAGRTAPRSGAGTSRRRAPGRGKHTPSCPSPDSEEHRIGGGKAGLLPGAFAPRMHLPRPLCGRLGHQPSSSRARLSSRTLTRGSPRKPNWRSWVWPAIRARTSSTANPRRRATRPAW
jgi:hypothetical protein